jgi:DNA-binding Xre family transcriptional regulator
MDSRQADLLSAEQIAEILLSLMRQTRGAVINFQRLEKSVENLISSPYSSRDD